MPGFVPPGPARPNPKLYWPGFGPVLSAAGRSLYGRLVEPAIDAATLFGDVSSGRQPIYVVDPETGKVSDDPRLIERAFNFASTLGAGGLATAPERAGLGVGGGKLRTPIHAPKSLPMDEASRMARAKEMGDLGRDFYHGTMRADRLLEGKGINPKRATSGPMPFFTDAPDMASSYAMGKKGDTSLLDEGDIAKYFTVSPKALGWTRSRTPITVEQSWHFLKPEQKQEILARAKRVGYENPAEATGPYTLHPPGVDASLSSNHFDWLMKTEAKGNPLTALRMMWHDGGNLVGSEQELEDIFRLAGYPHKISQTNAPWTEARGVMPARLLIKRPLDTSNADELRNKVIPRLREAFKGDRTRLQQFGADMWDKNTRYTPKMWLAQLEEDLSKGDNSFVWTSIPDKVTAALKGMGYDGILDMGGKMGGQGHVVAIPFAPHQVRSKFAAFDPSKADSVDILASNGKGGAAPGLALAALHAPGELPKPSIRAYHGSPHSLPMDVASQAARAKQMGFETDAYHGTRSPVDFEEFSTEGPPRNEMGETVDSGSGADPSAYMGAHFALEPQVASKFATGEGAKWLGARYVEGGGAGGRVLPVKLRGKFKKFKNDEAVQSFIYQRPSNHQAVEDELYRLADGDDEALGALGERYDSDPAFREEVNRDAMNAESQAAEDGGVSFAEDLASTARRDIQKEGFDGFTHKNTVEGGTAIAVFEPKNIRSRSAAFDPAKSDSGNLLASTAGISAAGVAALSQLHPEEAQAQEQPKMRRFLVEANGKKYEVQAPDPQSASATVQKMLGSMPASPATPSPTPAATADPYDAPKAFGAGVVRGLESLAGLPGDLLGVVDTGVRKAGSALGLPEPPANVQMGPIGRIAQAITPPTSQQTLAAGEAVHGPLYQPKTTAGKYARTAGEFAPGMLMGPGGFVRRAVTNVAIPAAASEAAGQATEGTPLEPYARLGGAIAGGFVPGGVRRLVTPNPASAERNAAVQTLANEGVDVSAGQATGKKSLQFKESETGGNAFADLMDKQGGQFTAAVLRRVGENADRATPEVIDRAFNRIGGEFDRVAASNQIVPDNQLLNDMAAAEADYANVVGRANAAPVIENTINNVLDHASRGPINGRVYQQWRSRLDTLARNQRFNNNDLAHALDEMRNALDDAMERSITAAGNQGDLAAWQQARQQYRNLLVVQKALAGGGEQAAFGIITPARLRMAAAGGKNRRNFVRGRSDFTDLAMAGQAVMTPPPNSGTAARTAARNIPGAAMGATGALLAGAPGAAAGIAASAAAPAIAGRIRMSRPVQRYLRNQVMPRPQTAEELHLALMLGTLMGPRMFGPPAPQP